MTGAEEQAFTMLSIGKNKAKLSPFKTLILAFMAGACIAFSGVGTTVVSATVDSQSAARLLSACVFPTGLSIIVFLGLELFTGNCLMVIPCLEQHIPIGRMLRNWVLVYIGNFLGSVFVAAMAVFGHTFSLFGNEVAVLAISTAIDKVSISFGDAIFRAIGCNILVCVAVWMASASKSGASKIVSLYLPVMLFVLCGYEHCVANMYFIPAGLFSIMEGEYLTAFGGDVSNLTWKMFTIKNMIPVTIGNIIGGACFVGLPMWLVYIRNKTA